MRRLRRQVIASRLGAYIRGEQSAEARRETATWLDHDAGMYADYRRAKQADEGLRADLGPHGRPERAQLDRAFANIGAALNGRAPAYRLHVRRPGSWRASLTAAALAVLLLIPLAASFNRAAATGIPTQPQPRSIVAEAQTATGEAGADALPDQTLTPALATAQLKTRSTPTAPDTD
jgi:anti-sigma factor RsiW